MGERGAKASAAGAAATAALVEALQPLGAVRSRAMFGGHGLFEDGVMFALVDSGGDAFLRADEALRPDFEAAGSTRHARMPYWSVPADVLEDDAQLLDWGGRALTAARAAKR
jgi:DNA transformation protein